MKHFRHIAVALLSCTLLICAAGCRDAEFNKAAKQPPTVKYIAVDEDLNLISNFVKERDIKSDGLSSDAYFLYGTESTLYFAVTPSDTRQTSTVCSYDIESREFSTLFSGSGHRDQGSGEEYLFYIAMASEDAFTCFYSYSHHKIFSNDEYFIRTEDYDLNGNKLASQEFSAGRVYSKFTDDKNTHEMIQFDYMAGKSDYYWTKRAVPVSQYIVSWVYSFNGVNGYHDINDMTSSDAMWELIHSEREYAAIFSNGYTFYQPYKNNAAFCLLYQDTANKENYVYFNYTEDGEPKYLFTRKDILLGLYVV